MPLFPTTDTLRSSFSTSTPFPSQKPDSRESQGYALSSLPSSLPSRRFRPCIFSDIFLSRDALEDTKAKAEKLKNAAAHEFDKASHKAQDAAGPIELYSLKYFVACTMGGILACV